MKKFLLKKEFTKYLTISHLYNMKAIYEKKSVDALHAKLSISLLRYCDLIRIDKLYYDAGMAAKKQVNFHNFMFYLHK